jgi:beta-RFAP synthase
MVTVQACGRLHFGLLNPGGGEADMRRFGGVGLMIERPELRLHVRVSSTWSATGPLAERALSFARRFTENTRREEDVDDGPPHSLRIECAMPEHAGLGSGTQLGLAVARALAVSRGLRGDLATLARRVGRGVRSALGAHGFERGGLLVESGKRSPDRLAPLVARLAFPESWCLVLVLPSTTEGATGLHGMREVEAFARLVAEPDCTDTLCRLVLLGLLPALVERDMDAFGAALHEFNVRVGKAFAPVQGGVYAGPRVAELVAFLRGQGVRGVGQSSWGPTVFAVAADEDHAQHLAAQLRRHFALNNEAVLVTPASNRGAIVTSESSPAPPG